MIRAVAGLGIKYTAYPSKGRRCGIALAVFWLVPIRLFDVHCQCRPCRQLDLLLVSLLPVMQVAA